VAAFN